eukprot:SAG31_NODE_406_length_16063_cov_22.636056_8_plen_152_part_01
MVTSRTGISGSVYNAVPVVPAGVPVGVPAGAPVSPIGIAKMQNENGFVAVYIDDLIVFSDTEAEHKWHLLKVMQVCSDEGLHLNPSKSHVFTQYTRYLGAICGNERLFMDPEKIEAICRMPTPDASQTAIREFLGDASFYRRWIDSYARITA